MEFCLLFLLLIPLQCVFPMTESSPITTEAENFTSSTEVPTSNWTSDIRSVSETSSNSSTEATSDDQLSGSSMKPEARSYDVASDILPDQHRLMMPVLNATTDGDRVNGTNWTSSESSTSGFPNSSSNIHSSSNIQTDPTGTPPESADPFETKFMSDKPSFRELESTSNISGRISEWFVESFPDTELNEILSPLLELIGNRSRDADVELEDFLKNAFEHLSDVSNRSVNMDANFTAAHAFDRFWNFTVHNLRRSNVSTWPSLELADVVLAEVDLAFDEDEGRRSAESKVDAMLLAFEEWLNVTFRAECSNGTNELGCRHFLKALGRCLKDSFVVPVVLADSEVVKDGRGMSSENGSKFNDGVSSMTPMDGWNVTKIRSGDSNDSAETLSIDEIGDVTGGHDFIPIASILLDDDSSTTRDGSANSTAAVETTTVIEDQVAPAVVPVYGRALDDGQYPYTTTTYAAAAAAVVYSKTAKAPYTSESDVATVAAAAPYVYGRDMESLFARQEGDHQSNMTELIILDGQLLNSSIVDEELFDPVLFQGLRIEAVAASSFGNGTSGVLKSNSSASHGRSMRRHFSSPDDADRRHSTDDRGSDDDDHRSASDDEADAMASHKGFQHFLAGKHEREEVGFDGDRSQDEDSENRGSQADRSQDSPHSKGSSRTRQNDDNNNNNDDDFTGMKSQSSQDEDLNRNTDRRSQDMQDRRLDDADHKTKHSNDRRLQDSNDRRSQNSEDRRSDDFDDRRTKHSNDRQSQNSDDRRLEDLDRSTTKDSGDRRSQDSDDRQSDESDLQSEDSDRRSHKSHDRTLEDLGGTTTKDSDDRRSPDSDDRRSEDSDDRRSPDSDDRRSPDSDDRRSPDSDDRRSPDSEDRRSEDSSDHRSHHSELSEETSGSHQKSSSSSSKDKLENSDRQLKDLTADDSGDDGTSDTNDRRSQKVQGTSNSRSEPDNEDVTVQQKSQQRGAEDDETKGQFESSDIDASENQSQDDRSLIADRMSSKSADVPLDDDADRDTGSDSKSRNDRMQDLESDRKSQDEDGSDLDRRLQKQMSASNRTSTKPKRIRGRAGPIRNDSKDAMHLRNLPSESVVTWKPMVDDSSWDFESSSTSDLASAGRALNVTANASTAVTTEVTTVKPSTAPSPTRNAIEVLPDIAEMQNSTTTTSSAIPQTTKSVANVTSNSTTTENRTITANMSMATTTTTTTPMNIINVTLKNFTEQPSTVERIGTGNTTKNLFSETTTEASVNLTKGYLEGTSSVANLTSTDNRTSGEAAAAPSNKTWTLQYEENYTENSTAAVTVKVMVNYDGGYGFEDIEDFPFDPPQRPGHEDLEEELEDVAVEDDSPDQKFGYPEDQQLQQEQQEQQTGSPIRDLEDEDDDRFKFPSFDDVDESPVEEVYGDPLPFRPLQVSPMIRVLCREDSDCNESRFEVCVINGYLNFCDCPLYRQRHPVTRQCVERIEPYPGFLDREKRDSVSPLDLEVTDKIRCPSELCSGHGECFSTAKETAICNCHDWFFGDKCAIDAMVVVLTIVSVVCAISILGLLFTSLYCWQRRSRRGWHPVSPY